MNTTRNLPSLWARGLRFILGFFALVVALAFGGLIWPSAAASQNSDLGQWADVVEVMQEKLNAVPEAGDPSAVQTLIRQAYYENYQTSGLEDQVKHALGRDVDDQFVAELLNLRNLSRDGASPEQLREASDKVVVSLKDTVTKLIKAPKVSDQWSRVADTIAQTITDAQSAYVKGQANRAFTLATEAYLGHYEADGFENNTIVHKGFSRVTEIEGMFSDLRQGYKDGRSQDQQEKLGKDLISKLVEDAQFLDEKTQDTGPLGISGFFAAFLILLREGAEALLVVAALVTYALKAGRRDQLRGILVGVIIAVVLSIGLAILFGQLSASVQSGMGQELLEGITGLAAALMLIYVSNWILSKSSGKRWEEYIKATAGEKTASGGVFALAFVSFLTVAREGAETILFFYPIVAGAKTHSDYWYIVGGGLTAVVILAIIFVLVWQFGVRLPLKPFFKWTSILLALLAIAIVGGAIKELQEAALVGAHVVPSVPTVVFLGIYPTAETLVAQIIVAAVLVVLSLLQRHQAKADKSTKGADQTQSDTSVADNNDKAPEEHSSREHTQDAVEAHSGKEE
ncbi:FTR1 family iron permease [Mobiluncus curtisii]|uniref:FTR1 family iron permease n=1 Tax=Mobiluncus curtisii TaxID=2051 RepID=UPI0002E95B0F|nr:FTR1 family protein [Mobiluncus curtisii]